MKKILTAIFALCFFATPALAQWANLAPSCTPDAVSFQESFGDDTQLCWASGPSTCTQTWTIGGGTAQSIAASPAGAPLYTACKNALKMTQIAAVNDFIWTVLPVTIPAGQNTDIVFTIYVTSNGMAVFDLTKLLAPSLGSDGASGPGLIYFRYDGTNLGVLGSGSTTSSQANISLNAWHTVKEHLGTGVTTSYIQVDGGTQNTFTENATAIDFIGIGDSGGNLDAMTYYIGNLSVSANNSPKCGSPQAFVDFEASTTGTTVTAALLNASTHFGNGTWTGSTSAQYTFQSAAQKGLLVGVDTCGAYFSGSGTLGFQFQISAAPPLFTYGWFSQSKVASLGMWFQTSALATDINFYSIGMLIGGSGAVDFAVPDIHGTGSQLQMFLETVTGNSPASVNISPNTWYWLTVQYIAGGTHSLAVYDAIGNQVGSTITKAATGNANPILAELGRTGSESGAPAATWWYDSLKMDYLKGQFPLLP